MRLSEIVIKVIGIVLAIVGLLLILSAVGLPFLGVALQPFWVGILVGVILMGAGLWVLRGGNVTL